LRRHPSPQLPRTSSMRISIHTPTDAHARDDEETTKITKKLDASLLYSLLFHAAFGAVHELAHLCAAWACGRLVVAAYDPLNIARALLGRHVLVATHAVGEDEVRLWSTFCIEPYFSDNISPFSILLCR
jgi:hypothetical protein